MDMEKAKGSKIPIVSFDEFEPPTHEKWHDAAVVALKGAPFEKRMFTKTYEGITLKPIYTLQETADLLKNEDLPGVFPNLRGAKTSGYIEKPWTISQSCSDVFPEEANLSMLHEIERGANAVHFEFDVCTEAGRDPDENLFTGDYRGVSVSTLEDIYDLIKNIDLSSLPVHVYAGFSSVPLLALFAAEAKASGREKLLKKYSGCIGADPIGYLASKGKIPIPSDELYDEMALGIQWAEIEMPHIKTILINGGAYHNGGSSATQEAAYAVAAAISYIRAMQLRGIEPETTIRHICFSLSLGANFFMEIARLRAIRTVWAKVAASFGVISGKAAQMDIIARTSQFTTTVYDPYVNILRATTQAFSGVIGGIESLQVGCFDDAVRPCGENAKRIARNIQIMLQTEFDLLQPADPAGGSWYIETLTMQAAEEIWTIIQDIDSRGGIIASLSDGFVQESIDKVFKSRLKNLALRSDKALGTNMYANTSEPPLECNSSNGTAMFEKRHRDICKYKEIMDERHTEMQLEKIMPAVTQESRVFLKAVINAFLAGATIGEVRETLNDGFAGEINVKPIGKHRWTEQFEALRKNTEDYIARTGENISVFLVNMGPVPQHKARADFSAGFMEVALFQVLRNTGFETVEDAVSAAVESRADVAVICSTDATYPELVPAIARGIKTILPKMKVLLAGAPAPEFKDLYTDAGVDDFIHVKANCYEILKAIQNSKEGFLL